MSDIAPDGSPVEFYRRIPETGEAKLIDELLPSGASILDLGCGPGRIAGPLAKMGHRVTGVDNSQAMLNALPAAVEGVLADASTVRLGRRFDCVLMASHLVSDPTAGPKFVATAAAHVAAGGLVVGETYAPGWDPAASVGRVSRLGDAEIRLVRARTTNGLLDAEVEYGVDGMTWRQPFTARMLDEPALRALLERGGLRFVRWLERPGWFSAQPAPASDPGG